MTGVLGAPTLSSAFLPGLVPTPSLAFVVLSRERGRREETGTLSDICQGAFLFPASFHDALPLGTGLCTPSGQAFSGSSPGGRFQCAMEAQSGEPLLHLPEVAPIKSDQEPLLPIDGLVPFHSECAATISLVSCKTINGDFPVPALSVLPVFKQLKDREKTLLQYSGLRAGPGQTCEKAGLAPSGQRTLPVFPPPCPPHPHLAAKRNAASSEGVSRILWEHIFPKTLKTGFSFPSLILQAKSYLRKCGNYRET